MRGLSLVATSGGHSSSRCAGLSLSQPLLLRSIGSRCAGSVVVAHGHSCSAARGIFPDQGSNPCPLHWQADSQPLRHQGSRQDTYIPFLLICLNSSIQMPDLSPEIWLIPKWAEMNGGMILLQFSCPWGLLCQILKLSNPFHLWPWPGCSEGLWCSSDQSNLLAWKARTAEFSRN